MADPLLPVSKGSLSPLVTDQRTINAVLGTTRDQKRNVRKRPGSVGFDEPPASGVSVDSETANTDSTGTGWTAILTPIASDADRLYIATFFITAPAVTPLTLHLCIGQWDDSFPDPNDAPSIRVVPSLAFGNRTFDGNACPHTVIGYLPSVSGKHVAPLWKKHAGTEQTVLLVHFSYLPATAV